MTPLWHAICAIVSALLSCLQAMARWTKRWRSRPGTSWATIKSRVRLGQEQHVEAFTSSRGGVVGPVSMGSVVPA